MTKPSPDKPIAGEDIQFGAVTRRLLPLVGIALLGLLALLVFTAHASYQDMAERTNQQAQSTVRLLGREAERMVEAADLMLEQMRAIARGTDWSDARDVAEASETLHHLQGLLPDSFRLFVFSPDGRIRATSIKADPRVTAAGRDYFQAHVEKDGGLYISDPLHARIDGRPIFVLSRRVEDEAGRFQGVVSVSFEPGMLTDFYRSIDTMEGAVFIWAKPNRRILMRVPPVSEELMLSMLAAPELGDVARSGVPSGHIVYRSGFDGEDRMSFYQRIGKYPLYVAYGISRETAFRNWMRETWLRAGFAVLALAGLTAAAIYAVRAARAEDRRKHDLAGLNRRLVLSNQNLERRVLERTAQLTDTLVQKDELIAQKEELLREVNHRVKNSLQLVASLLRMQGQMMTESGIQRQFGEAVARVTAIARVHAQLHFDDEVRSVEALGYLRGICSDLEGLALTSQGLWRVRVAGDQIQIPTDKAVPLGLIVNELVTNAFKHASPNPGDPNAWTVQVELVREQGAGDGETACRLSVRDFGPGLAQDDLPERPGSLGMRLLQAFTTQISGTIETEPAHPGTRFVLRFAT